MGYVMLTFLLLWLGSGTLGVKVLVAALRAPLEPLLPSARIVAGGVELAYQHATDAAVRGTRSALRIGGVALGMAMILWPIAVISWFFTTSRGIGSL